MMNTLIEYFRSLPGIPFVVQFVTVLNVEGQDTATQITSYLIVANSEEEAQEMASAMLESLSDSYRNSEGTVVRAKCLGIHSLEAIDYADSDGKLELGVFQFSRSTIPEQLISEPLERDDLPLLD